MVIDKATVEMVYHGESSFTIPKEISAVKDEAFQSQRSLQNVILEEGVISIGAYSFASTGLKQVELPSSLKYADSLAFAGCQDLTAITVSEDNTKYCSQDGILYSKDMKTLVKYPEGKTNDSYQLPESVELVADGALSGCIHLKTVDLHEHVSFENASSLFNCCKNLKEFQIPDSVSGLGVKSFAGTAWLQGKRAWTPLVVVNHSLVDGTAFAKDSIKLSDEVSEIGYGAFASNQKIKEALLLETVQSIGELAFVGCKNLEHVKIPESVAVIEMGTFSGCSNLKQVELAENLTEIREYAFCNCSNLSVVAVPDSVVKIGESAFDEHVLIQCNPGSYAEHYANQNGLKTILPEQIQPKLSVFAVINGKDNQRIASFFKTEDGQYYKNEAVGSEKVRTSAKSILARINQALKNPDESVKGHRKDFDELRGKAAKQNEGREDI